MNTKNQLLVEPKKGSNIYQSVTPESANWNYLSFEARISISTKFGNTTP